jgi:hypothetical protein
MRITSRGQTAYERLWTGKCDTCKSEAEATEAELTNIKPDRDGKFSWEQCPVCKAGYHGQGYGGMLFHPKKEN